MTVRPYPHLKPPPFPSGTRTRNAARHLRAGAWVLLQWAFSATRRALVVLAVLGLVALVSREDVKKTGNRLQVALPLLAWGCAAVNGDALEYLGRYVVMFATVRLGKTALGDAAINQRPRGDSHGMPSAHTSTASFGASRLVSDCVKGNPVVQLVAVLSAGFVGLSRVDAGAHTPWQVIMGAITGLLCDRAFGKGSRSRDQLAQQLRRLRRIAGRRPWPTPLS